jgi:hypothetical protein
MPMISKYARPLATTPTMPSTIATITSSRKRAIVGSSAQLGGSAAGQPPFTGGTRLVCQAVVLKMASSPAAGSSLSVPIEEASFTCFLPQATLRYPGSTGN